VANIVYIVCSFPLTPVLVVLVPILLAVAFMTAVERKVMGHMQRRIGPNIVGLYGTLQPFADALKLVMKETVVPTSSNHILFYLAPAISLVFAMLGWAVIPFGPGAAISNMELAVLYSLAVSSIGVYGVLLAGWSANEVYAFIGGLRSTAQMVSYELVLGSAVLAVLIISGTLSYNGIVESQLFMWNIVPLAPMFILFVISVLAETNRTPFDLPEAESELVSGYMTEHSAMPFVLFFLAEYCSIVLMSAFSATLFLGGWGFPELFVNTTVISISSLVLAVKACMGCFAFVWVRATLPRQRYDGLMNFAWTGLLPMAIALLLVTPSILVGTNVI
jgi:NADH:ubiquinone oxidoreductase subunit H